jgi:hypothetical protein
MYLSLYLQFDRFNFSDESLVVLGEERTDHVEHGVTEATDVHDVSSFASLNRLVRRSGIKHQLHPGLKATQKNPLNTSESEVF